MNVSDKTHQELARISASLSRAVRSARPEEWRQIARKTIRQIDTVIEQVELARAANGASNGHSREAIAPQATLQKRNRPNGNGNGNGHKSI